jgi:transposase InsO family protein
MSAPTTILANSPATATAGFGQLALTHTPSPPRSPSWAPTSVPAGVDEDTGQRFDYTVEECLTLADTFGVRTILAAAVFDPDTVAFGNVVRSFAELCDRARDRDVPPSASSKPPAQAARNLVMGLEDAGTTIRYLIRDRDTKYPILFDQILSEAGIQVILTGIRVPRMNAIMERWVQTCRRELLDRTLIWTERHLRDTLPVPWSDSRSDRRPSIGPPPSCRIRYFEHCTNFGAAQGNIGRPRW